MDTVMAIFESSNIQSPAPTSLGPPTIITRTLTHHRITPMLDQPLPPPNPGQNTLLQPAQSQNLQSLTLPITVQSAVLEIIPEEGTPLLITLPINTMAVHLPSPCHLLPTPMDPVHYLPPQVSFVNLPHPVTNPLNSLLYTQWNNAI
jgi:hypothetical protein